MNIFSRKNRRKMDMIVTIITIILAVVSLIFLTTATIAMWVFLFNWTCF